MAPIDSSTLAFAATILVNSRGAKTLPVFTKDGANVAWQLETPLEVTFEPSAYNDPGNTATRVTMCLTPSDAVRDQIVALDEWCIRTLAANPLQLIGVQLSVDQIRDRYVSCLKTNEKGYATLRLKMNRCGRYALQCFTPEREKRAFPSAWRGTSVRAQITFRGLFLMGRDFGPVLELTHAIVHEPEDELCPF